MNDVPEWANWVARDVDRDLYVFNHKPEKIGGEWITWTDNGKCKVITGELKESFNDVKWTDEEPTRITHERVHVDKGGADITVGEIARIYFEDTMNLVENKMENETATTHTNTNKDMVNQPNHYIGEYGLEVEDVLRNFIPRYTDPYVGHRIASAIEYLLRSPLKNGQQDIEKARKNLYQALVYIEEKELRINLTTNAYQNH